MRGLPIFTGEVLERMVSVVPGAVSRVALTGTGWVAGIALWFISGSGTEFEEPDRLERARRRSASSRAAAARDSAIKRSNSGGLRMERNTAGWIGLGGRGSTSSSADNVKPGESDSESVFLSLTSLLLEEHRIRNKHPGISLCHAAARAWHHVARHTAPNQTQK